MRRLALPTVPVSVARLQGSVMLRGAGAFLVCIPSPFPSASFLYEWEIPGAAGI